MGEEEFRKVAEDVRALARSLARDVRDAVDQARSAGYPTSQAFKHSLRGVAKEAKRNVRQSWPHTGYGRRGCPPWAPSPPPPGRAGPTPGRPDGGGPSWTGPTYGPWGRPPWTPRPHHSRRPLPPVRRRWDATTILGILAVLFGVAWLIGALGAVHVSVEAVVAVGLMLLGAALVVTGRTDWSLSRRSWPVWLGAGMIVVLIVTSSTFGVGNAISHMSFGNQSFAPTGSQTINGGFGNLTVDLSKVPSGSIVSINSIAGETHVKVPKNATVHTNAHVAAGQICGTAVNQSSGLAASSTTTHGSDANVIDLNIHQVFGQVVVGDNNCTHGSGQ